MDCDPQKPTQRSVPAPQSLQSFKLTLANVFVIFSYYLYSFTYFYNCFILVLAYITVILAFVKIILDDVLALLVTIFARFF